MFREPFPLAAGLNIFIILSGISRWNLVFEKLFLIISIIFLQVILRDKNYQYGNPNDNDNYYFLGISITRTFYNIPCPTNPYK